MEEQLSATARDASAVNHERADADREKRVLEDSLITLQEKNRRLESQLERWRKELTEARAELDEANHRADVLKSKELQNAQDLTNLRAGQQSMEQLEKEVKTLKRLAKQLQEENARLLRNQVPGGGGGDSANVAKLEQENRDLRAELSSFDPAFWEEIEDLKFREHESKRANQRYEKKISEYEQMLTDLSRQYGFPFRRAA